MGASCTCANFYPALDVLKTKNALAMFRATNFLSQEKPPTPKPGETLIRRRSGRSPYLFFGRILAVSFSAVAVYFAGMQYLRKDSGITETDTHFRQQQMDEDWQRMTREVQERAELRRQIAAEQRAFEEAQAKAEREAA